MPSAQHAPEVASAVPYRDAHQIETQDRAFPDDAETALKRRAQAPSSNGSAGSDGRALIAPETPFFHFDLAAAVRAAEAGAERAAGGGSGSVADADSMHKR